MSQFALLEEVNFTKCYEAPSFLYNTFSIDKHTLMSTKAS